MRSFIPAVFALLLLATPALAATDQAPRDPAMVQPAFVIDGKCTEGAELTTP